MKGLILAPMSMTKTDLASVLASAVGFIVAIYGVVNQPIVADSVRPKQGEPSKPRGPP